MLDVNGQSIGDGTLELVKFAETASAVNEITVTNSATGNAPEIAATGDDTNIDLKLTPKGTGKLNLDGIKFPNADGSAGQALTTNGSGILSFSTISADGTADWDTTVKTTGFTATANKGYFCNTTSAAFTVTLPATPSAGDEVILVDYAGTFDTNKLTISPNGNKIEGSTDNVLLSGEREGARLVYIDSTQGWLAYSGINEGTDALSPTSYSVDFLVIAGGASGGRGSDNSAGGGGAGGYRNSYSTETSGGGGSSEASLTFNVGTVYTVTVGAGGSARTSDARGASGTDSSVSGTGITTITSSGGGGGGAQVINGDGIAGGSGGGASYGSSSSAQTGGAGTANQGFRGGNKQAIAFAQGAGGGGAGAQGVDCTNNTNEATNGGAGLASSITGSSVTRTGGGAGVAINLTATGGSGGGGNSSATGTSDSGTVNTGSGGGGTRAGTSGAGGSGVVILRIPTANYSGTTTGSPTVTTDGSDKVIVFTGSGSITG
jgi:hypothetical protein